SRARHRRGWDPPAHSFFGQGKHGRERPPPGGGGPRQRQLSPHSLFTPPLVDLAGGGGEEPGGGRGRVGGGVHAVVKRWSCGGGGAPDVPGRGCDDRGWFWRLSRTKGFADASDSGIADGMIRVGEETVTTGSSTSTRVLIIDDDERLNALLTKYLAPFGFSVR